MSALEQNTMRQIVVFCQGFFPRFFEIARKEIMIRSGFVDCLRQKHTDGMIIFAAPRLFRIVFLIKNIHGNGLRFVEIICTLRAVRFRSAFQRIINVGAP